MATIRKRGTSYQAIVKQKGFPIQRKNFKTNATAKAWARQIESSMDTGSWIDTRARESVFIDKLIDNLIHGYTRFGIEIKGPKMNQLKMLQRYFEGVSIHDLTCENILAFAGMRRQGLNKNYGQKAIAASTLQYQIYYLRQALKHSHIRTKTDEIKMAIDELKLKNQITGSVERDRRLEKGEYDKLIQNQLVMYKKQMGPQSKYIHAAIDIAIESAMRQGEIHALRWSNIDFEKGLITVWRKNKHAEGGKTKAQIPLLKGVRAALLRHRNVLGKTDLLFEVKKASSMSDEFAKLCKKAGIVGLHFHDLRHEALSRLFDMGMNPAHVLLVSGHRSLDQLSRYLNPRSEDVIKAGF